MLTINLLPCVLLFLLADAREVPTHSEITGAVASHREKVRSLHVRATCVRTLPLKQAAKNELFLDADAKRWRWDRTDLNSPEASGQGWGNPAFVAKTSVDGDFVYRFSPENTRTVVVKDSLKHPKYDRSPSPFPDPRNAGLIHTFSGSLGTPFAVGGTRLPVYTGQIDASKGDGVKVDSAEYNGTFCWRVTWEWDRAGASPRERYRREYLVAPDMDFSVLRLKTDIRYGDDGAPSDTFLVETEVSLHEDSQIWFPRKVHYEAIVDGRAQQDEVTDFEIVSLNGPIEAEVFRLGALGVPPGHTVVDFTGGKPGKIWDGQEVVAPARPARSARSVSGSDSKPVLLLAAASGLVVLSVLVWIRGRRR